MAALKKCPDYIKKNHFPIQHAYNFERHEEFYLFCKFRGKKKQRTYSTFSSDLLLWGQIYIVFAVVNIGMKYSTKNTLDHLIWNAFWADRKLAYSYCTLLITAVQHLGFI